MLVQFQSTPPRERRRRNSASRSALWFQSTPPRERRRLPQADAASTKGSNPRLRARGDGSAESDHACETVPIHASVREATAIAGMLPSSSRGSNPRLRARGDFAPRLRRVHHGSNPRLRARGDHAQTRTATCGVPIHASAREATYPHAATGDFRCSNPRLRARGDMRLADVARLPHVPIHASAREATRGCEHCRACRIVPIHASA